MRNVKKFTEFNENLTSNDSFELNGFLYKIDKSFKIDKSKLDEDGVCDEYSNLDYIIIPNKYNQNDPFGVRLGKFDHVNLEDLSYKISPEDTLVILKDGDECAADELFPILQKIKIN